MKRLLTFIFAVIIALPIFASSLVLIPTKSFDETRLLFDDRTLTIHFYNDNFIIATILGEPTDNAIVLDKNPWQNDNSYYIVYVDKSVDKDGYLNRIDSYADLLFDGTDFLIVKIDETKHGQLPPAKNDGMVRIRNIEAKLPAQSNLYARFISEPDPFVEELLDMVNGENITATVQHLQDYGTRDAYTLESVEAQEWISEKFDQMGLSVEIMDFYMPGGSASDNVIAKLRGTTYPNEYVVVGAHYDSYSWWGDAPGADDNASGTAAVLEIARILSEYEFERSIVFCAFSGEEYGLYGSAAYAYRSAAEGMDIIGYFNLDMIGYLESGNSILTTLIYPQSAKPLADFYTHVCSVYLPDFIVQPGNLSGGDSDHTSFNINGYMGIFPFENINAYSPYIHTKEDTIGLSYNNEQQAVVFTKAALASVVTLTYSELTGIPQIENHFSLHPNPAKDYVSIKLSIDETALLEVISLQGQVLLSRKINDNEIIDVSSWAPGIYLFRIVSRNGNKTQRVIIK